MLKVTMKYMEFDNDCSEPESFAMSCASSFMSAFYLCIFTFHKWSWFTAKLLSFVLEKMSRKYLLQYHAITHVLNYSFKHAMKVQ